MTSLTETRRANRSASWGSAIMVWGIFALVLILIPFLLNLLDGFRGDFDKYMNATYGDAKPFWNFLVQFVLPKKSFALTIFVTISITAIFALSYNMLLGQGGMLSFGHAVYSGLAGYFAMHVLHTVGNSEGILSYFPPFFTPILGGLFAMIFGIIIGSFSTKKAGTIFAMISLGIAELTLHISHIAPWFGGEEGVEGNRDAGNTPEILNLGSDQGLYYLAVFWLFLATFFMFRFSRTPAGRMANAVRDNPERVEFVGYNMRYVRYVTFIAASFFAGVAGAVSAMKQELIEFAALSPVESGIPLIVAYIGGMIFFIGPIVGAIVYTLLQDVVAAVAGTQLSLLYAGLIFLFVVLYVPYGITGIILQHAAAIKSGRSRYLIAPYIALFIPVVMTLTGLIGFFELTQFVQNAAVGETTVTFLGISYDAAPKISFLPEYLSVYIPRIYFLMTFVVGVIGIVSLKGYVAAAWERVEAGPEKAKDAEKVGEKATA